MSPLSVAVMLGSETCCFICGIALLPCCPVGCWVGAALVSWLAMYSALISLYVDALIPLISGSADCDFSFDSPGCVGLGLVGGPEFRRCTTGDSGVRLRGVIFPCEAG